MVIDLRSDRANPDDAALDRSDRIRRYVRAEMAEAELAEFELALFEDSGLVEEVEAEFAWRDGLRASSGSSQTAATATPPASSAPPSSSPGWPRWALAASLLLGVGIGSTLSLLRAPAAELRTAHLVPLTALRGAETGHELVVPAGDPLVLRYLARNPIPHHMTISDAAGRIVIERTDLQPDPQGWLVLIGPSLSTSGTPYRIDLSSAEQAERFEVRVE